MECALCHNAAAGHDKMVPPDHECKDHQEDVLCFDCDEEGYMAQWQDTSEEWSQ